MSRGFGGGDGMTKPLVQIIGSAPRCDAVDCDVAIFANFSIIREDGLAHSFSASRRIVLIAETALYPECFISENQRVAQILKLRERLYECEIDQMIVLRTSFPSRHSGRRPVGDRGEYSVEAASRDLRAVAGLSLPIIDSSILRSILSLSALQAYRELRHLGAVYRRRIAGLPFHVRGPYRPSTGVMALIWAFARYGADCKYRTAGIDFKTRTFHAIHKNPDQTYGILPQHVFADQVVLRRISANQRFPLETS